MGQWFDVELDASHGDLDLRDVLLWMLLTAWMALNFAGRGWAIPSLLWLGIVVLLGFAVAAFLLPLLGPHRRLRDTKRAELSRVRGALRSARDRVLAAPANEVAGGRLADLVAIESALRSRLASLAGRSIMRRARGAARRRSPP